MEWLEKAVFYSVDTAVDAAECRGEVICYYSVQYYNAADCCNASI